MELPGVRIGEASRARPEKRGDTAEPFGKFYERQLMEVA